MALATTVSFNIRTVLTAALDLSQPKDDLSVTFADSLDSGTAIDQADVVWHDQRTLTSGANETLDLQGSLTNGLGTTALFAKVKALYIANTSTTAANILTVGDAAAPITSFFAGTNPAIKVGPGGILFLYNPSLAGYAVTATTADGLKIANAGSTSTVYNIVIVGTSA